MTAELYIDGATQGSNPGVGGIGGYLTFGQSRFEFYDKLTYMTNNVAEYNALVRGLELCVEHLIDDVIVYSDSKLVVNQMRGIWKIKHQDMKTLYGRAKVFADQIKNVKYQWIPREQNTEADRLSKLAFGNNRDEESSKQDVVEIVMGANRLFVKESVRAGDKKLVTIKCLF